MIPTHPLNNNGFYVYHDGNDNALREVAQGGDLWLDRHPFFVKNEEERFPYGP